MAPKSAEGKGKGGGKAAPKKKATLTKSKANLQVASDTKLSPEDDERTSMSKKISWILRKGAERINIEIDKEGWVKLSSLMKADILEDFPERTEEKLMACIEDSNSQKLRYETKKGPDGETLVRAYTKVERKKMTGGETKEISIATSTEPTAVKNLRPDAPSFVPGQAPAPVVDTTAAPMSPTSMGQYMGYPGFGFPFGYPWPYGFGMPQSPGGQKFQGRIKSFNQEKGYGFIDSPDAQKIYGRDVFLHKAHVGNLAVGAIVSFSVEMNKQNMPQARELQAVEGGKGSKAGKDGKGKGKGKPKAKAKKEKGEKKGAEGEGGEALPPGEVDGSAAPAAEAAAPEESKS